MYHIAIVEDEAAFAAQLKSYLIKYQEEHGLEFQISIYSDGVEILEGYCPKYDIILLDIEMPKVNGMDAAEKIRDLDENVVLMFITNMSGYAIRGYSVGALDFVMKPVNYYTFERKLARALKRVRQREQKQILLVLPNGMKKLELKQIYYVEVQNRMLYYHTDEGVHAVRGTMQGVEAMMAEYPFVKCNHWYLVNLMNVKEIQGNIVKTGPHALEISRRNKAAFLKALTEYMGGGI